ncbi:MAG: 2Fe-2S iron-sulfur cluster-binding protein [Proteobacteria bacterium]|nr:2Fe-2S iron-sulfur cluster-binding protein [Cystobacterineae bacterium]MCL2259554.1 2Fe-2S iron-sulfur cluster-binding protein [Cystobacterineae bacterium]MCL2313964.1 2Fe-2S iron-sulfur cluster-binding protein [Pseudomonadota bacterium]
MPQIRFILPWATQETHAHPGQSILEVGKAANVPLGHMCGGVCACSTCHIWVRQGADSLPQPEVAELDQLEHAFGLKPHSRLACQALVGEEALEVVLTEESLKAYFSENPDEACKLRDKTKASK